MNAYKSLEKRTTTKCHKKFQNNPEVKAYSTTMVNQRLLTFLTLFAAVCLSDVRAMVSKPTRRAFLNQSGLTGAFLLGLTPTAAKAYERRDVGDPASMSAATYAFNLQAVKTNNRLEAEGFKLDTREEEKAKISAAMASFSYESATTNKKKTGYGSKASKSAASPTTN